MYFDEDLMLEIRLNTLNEIVDKFVICEATRDHGGNKKKLNFVMKKFSKFKSKIEYLIVDDVPLEVKINKKNWHENHIRDQFQRNAIHRALKGANDDDWIMISDIDEIPDPNKIKEFDIKKNYLLFSGIGNPNSFKDILLENNFNVIDNIIFPDHFEYNEKDIQKIKNRARKLNAQIVTTEKDFVKIKENYRNNINFLKIDLEIDREENFVNFINSKIND